LAESIVDPSFSRVFIYIYITINITVLFYIRLTFLFNFLHTSYFYLIRY